MSERQDLARADEEARRAALTEFQRPLVLEAGAGTGKTTTLVGRLITWCLGPGWAEAATGDLGAEDPETVARKVLDGVTALTFTDAAAAEMAKRTANWLARVASGQGESIPGLPLATLDLAPLSELERRAAALLDQLDLLTVRTVHSFCHGLLAQHPFAAGLHPRLEVDSDGYRTEQLVFEQVEARFPAWARNERGMLSVLAQSRIGPSTLAQGAQELLAKGLADGALARPWFGVDDLGGLARRVMARVEALLDAARPFTALTNKNAASLNLLQTLDQIRTDLGETIAAGTKPELLRGIEETAVRLDDGKSSGRLKDWSRKRFNRGESEVLSEEDASTVATAARELRSLGGHLVRLDPQLFRALRNALGPIVSAVRHDLRSRGLITFHDLLESTVQLLAEKPEITTRLRRRTRQLLVDEVQDTDPLQYRIVSLLALRGTPRPGLFVVGDPKQSIYGWRQADLGAYESFLCEVRKAGGKIMNLSANFRSRAEILAEVKRAIAPVMQREAGVQPPFVELLAARNEPASDLAGRRRPVEYWISWPHNPEHRFTRRGEPPSDDAARIEAQAIANDLLDLHRVHDVSWSDCGILLRSRNRFDFYLDALRERAIPFSVSRDTLYYRRREIIDIAALIRLIVDPTDRLALLTWLRSPFVGVPDAVLLPLWQQGFPEATQHLGEPGGTSGLAGLIEEARSAIDPERAPAGELALWNVNLEHSCLGLAELRRSFACDAADTFLEHLRNLTQLEATAAARFQGRHRLANLDRLLRHVESTLEESGGDNQRLLRTLRRGVAEAQEEEEARPQTEDGEAVSLLTIHGAKGLEFPYLWVANLGAAARSGQAAQWDSARAPEAGGGWELVLHGAPSPGWDAIEERRVRTSEAERVRTLYVAMTRAAERLVLLGGWHKDGADKLRQRPPADHLALLARRQGGVPELAALWDELEERQESDYVDEDGVRWAFPGLDPLLRSSETTPPEKGSTPSAKRVREESLRLAELRGIAAKRMGRPFADSPSRLASVRSGATEEAEITSSRGDDDARTGAALLGTRVHHLFESWDLAAEPEEELDRQRLQLMERIDDRDAESTRAASELLNRLANGNLWRRFAALGDRVLARELPMLLPGEERGDGPVGYLAGQIDLIYRDEDDALVIADYKTDRVEGEKAIAERAAGYAPQVEAYRRAVEDALSLPSPPRFELWFLWPDQIVEL